MILFFENIVRSHEGLCNQLMGVFRTVGEALFFSSKGHSVGVILNEFYTRTSINFDSSRKIPIDSFIDMQSLTTLLSSRNILVIQSKKEIPSLLRKNIFKCERMPLNRKMSIEEHKNMGIFIANFFPFAKKVQDISSLTINELSVYKKWKGIHLRIERDLLTVMSEESLDILNITQIKTICNSVSSDKDLSTIYIASGLQENEYNRVVCQIKQQHPYLTILNKSNILKNNPKIEQQFNSLCLEEQALVDWLVCLEAPFFSGCYFSSFAYLAAYMRHYRGFRSGMTKLEGSHEFWDEWFPRL
ncbi:GDP-fucose protein O-fucosyltransferase [Marininema mesophilum]|uniref:GDP-fucose protein O-fucosyltransferase n=1 Tax=Marininema mesophilum TaxID=1048340 RepID=A0A1H2ZLX9_9BACL|nr:hypothetical protein [Marininema mesophilum]SDX18512.1 GDP-fucose protein O-fucosyltransferase [Marininema mesophilum]